jgi:type IV pilus assembly protein PilB
MVFLYDIMHPPLKLRDALISRVKIMSKLDISEKRLPQDGRIKIKVKVDARSRELDFRVSTLPTLFGEKGCASSTRQREPDAGHDQARV